MKKKLVRKYGELNSMNMEQMKQYMEAYDRFMVLRGVFKEKVTQKINHVFSDQEINSGLKSVAKLRDNEESQKKIKID